MEFILILTITHWVIPFLNHFTTDLLKIPLWCEMDWMMFWFFVKWCDTCFKCGFKSPSVKYDNNNAFVSLSSHFILWYWCYGSLNSPFSWWYWLHDCLKQESSVPSSQLAEPLWTDPGVKSGFSVRELISTHIHKKKPQAGNAWSTILPKSSEPEKSHHHHHHQYSLIPLRLKCASATASED